MSSNDRKYIKLTSVLKILSVSLECHTQAKRKCLFLYNIDVLTLHFMFKTMRRTFKLNQNVHAMWKDLLVPTEHTSIYKCQSL